ncbi:hypothetical protein ATCC90586_004395 [Pythium insidiosum]|nr:hypothetical protein ATCC90586_004395 [Pythium insidiosum]
MVRLESMCQDTADPSLICWMLCVPNLPPSQCALDQQTCKKNHQAIICAATPAPTPAPPTAGPQPTPGPGPNPQPTPGPGPNPQPTPGPGPGPQPTPGPGPQPTSAPGPQPTQAPSPGSSSAAPTSKTPGATSKAPSSGSSGTESPSSSATRTIETPPMAGAQPIATDKPASATKPKTPAPSSSAATLVVPMAAVLDSAALADVADRSVDVVVFNRVLTFASDQQAKLLAKQVLRVLRADGVVTFRESCLQEPYRCEGATYRHPSFYIGLFGTAVLDDASHGFAYLDSVHCKSLGVYRRVTHSHGELVFTYRKIEQPAEEEEVNSRGRSLSQQVDNFQNFLDNQQYSNESITRYEKIFGEGYVSTGGQVTTTEFVAMLDLKPGQHVLDVGCGIGGGDFYMANSFGVSVHGIDLSTNMVYRAIESYATHHKPRDGNDVEFEICDATTKSFPPHSFDVVYSRDTILHIEDKRALFTQFFSWLKPGGKLLISDYCCGDEQPPSEHFKAYVKRRGYVLLSPRQYGDVLTAVGFHGVRAEDRTAQFVSVLKEELARTYKNKKAFIEETSEADFNDIVQGWEAKLARCADGDQKWGLFLAVKP